MGAYVNTKDNNKEKWLRDNGEARPMSYPFDAIPDGSMAVVLMDNGPFTAAGICYSESEFKEFTNPNDTREKQMYIVTIDKLHTVSPELAGYMK